MIKLSKFGNYRGYLTGHNSQNSKAYSELFDNSCGYSYISGAKIKFGKIKQVNEDAKINVVVWSARGVQGGPNPVIERKEVLFKQIKEDINNNRATTITFDRLTPIFSKAFHIGIELTYAAGDTLAVVSSADGQSTKSTSWVQDQSGQWSLMTIAYGANIAMDIQPVVGANPSVQVSATKQLIYPGEEVRLNGQGASIFVWNSDDGAVDNVAGPQLIVNPTKQTTYITTGSGLDLCNTTTSTTIYIREVIVGIEPAPLMTGISVYPNPGSSTLSVTMDNDYEGDVTIGMQSALGVAVNQNVLIKKQSKIVQASFETIALQPGVYLVVISMGKSTAIKKWIKL